jgi:predicted aldo/keto reductase-like oxidoreductase
VKYRALGNTGLNISEVGFGCIPIIRLPADDAVRVLQHAYGQGITFYDTANAYRDSEAKIGMAFQGIRDKVVLATKTMKRDAAGAREHLETSLRMLKTDYIDLFQLHQVAQEKDWQSITAAGGALEAAIKAKEEGKVRHIGITSHNLSMAIKLMKTGIFETIMFPFNFIEDAAKEEMISLAQESKMAFIAMKPFAGGAIDNAALAFKFLRQYPEAVVIPGFDSVSSVDEVLSFYERANTFGEQDRAAIEQVRKNLGKQFCRRCEYCQPCPQGVAITPAMGYPIVAARMSPAVSVEFSKGPMESVPKCVECGVCISRCPYELPIPEILKRNYALYEQHKQA